MKICVIVNQKAGSADQFEQLQEALRQREDTVCMETDGAGHAVALAEEAVREGFDMIAAAGGDGTINEVVNGIMRAGGDPILAVLPLGTGNDLARLLDVSTDPRDAMALLRAGEVRRLDVFEVETGDDTVFGINAAAGGFSGQVDEMLTPELKRSWGPLAYLIGAASVLPDVHNYETYVAFDDEPPEPIDALNIIVANGRTVGGGKRVAPLSNPEDGLLDVVVVRFGNVVELGEVAARLVTGNYLNSPHVEHRQVRQVRVRSKPGMWFNVDGELFTKEPLTFRVRAGALRVVVGNGYRADLQPE